MGFFKNWTRELNFAGGRNSIDQQRLQAERQRKKELKQQEKKLGPTCVDYLWLDRRARIFYIILLCFVLGIVIPSMVSYFLYDYQVYTGKCSAGSIYKFECLSGYQGNLDESTCTKADCCWDDKSTPKCFHRTPSRYTYSVSSVTRNSNDDNKIYKYVVQLEPQLRNEDPFGYKLADNIKVVVQAVNRHHLVIQMLKADEDETNFRLLTTANETSLDESDFKVTVSTRLKRSFSIRVARASSDQDVLIDTSRGPMIISQNDDEKVEYVEMTTTLGSMNLFGLGQDRRTKLDRDFSSSPKMALYNRKTSEASYDSFHPFFMVLNQTASGATYGVFWENTNPLEVQLTPAPSISFRSMGGRAVLHLFSGPTPAKVSEQYTQDIVGPIRMPPFWALGFHLCRENNNRTVFKNTFSQMNNAIGFDSDCIDLRLSGPGSGTIDKETFPNAEDDRQLLSDAKKKFMLAQPPHIIPTDDQNMDLILKEPEGNTALIGSRFNVSVFYPSFPKISDNQMLFSFNMDAMLDPDAIIFVDNFPSNEKWSATNCTQFWRFIPEKLGGKLNINTICSDAVHPVDKRSQLEAHNTYGVEQLQAFDLQRQQQEQNDRLLYLNQAGALGNLGIAGYPGDDLPNNWYFMKMALVQVLESGLFGVPLAGSPICGSTNTSNLYDILPVPLDEEQLCLRWYQLGLLLPLSQSLSRLHQRPRSPVDWSKNTQKIVAGAIQQRYQLLSYYYSLFYEASISGKPVVRPLFYEFPTDNQTYTISNQFMIGDSILVCPVMDQDLTGSSSTKHDCYFPSSIWYDYYSGQPLPETLHNGNFTTLITALSAIEMFVRNGSVFFTQESKGTVFSAEEYRINNYIVTVALPFSEAVGYLYVDDGSTTSTNSDYIEFRFNQTYLAITVKQREFSDSDSEIKSKVSTTVEKIRIFGASQLGSSFKSTYNNNTDVLEIPCSFNWYDKPEGHIEPIQLI